MSLEPPNSREIQEIVEKRLRTLDGLQESVTVDWRDKKLSLPVISMPIGLVFYNPNTRRVQAQRSIDPDRERELQSNPFSDESQGYLDELLRWDPASPGKVDPAFEKLKDDLQEHGQDEPGLLTRAGVLINGNTRRAALRSLGREHIRVGILPEDASRADIDALELSLQLRRSLKRDYSFVNGLLAVAEEVRRGTQPTQILRAFRMKQERLDRSIWLLNFIDDAIRRSSSSVAGGLQNAALRRFDFERDQGQLEELYRAWSTLNRSDPSKAEVLRETRLIAVVLDFAKTDLRVMDEKFFELYAEAKLPSDLLPGQVAITPGAVPGLPDVQLPAEPETLRKVRTVADAVLKAAAREKVATVDTPMPMDSAKVLSDVRQVFQEARTKAGASAELRRKAISPSERILEAGDAIDAACVALHEARAMNALDVPALEDALEILRKSMTRLAQLLSRVPDDTKDVGFNWLEAAVNASPENSSQ